MAFLSKLNLAYHLQLMLCDAMHCTRIVLLFHAEREAAAGGRPHFVQQQAHFARTSQLPIERRSATFPGEYPCIVRQCMNVYRSMYCSKLDYYSGATSRVVFKSNPFLVGMTCEASIYYFFRIC